MLSTLMAAGRANSVAFLIRFTNNDNNEFSCWWVDHNCTQYSGTTVPDNRILQYFVYAMLYSAVFFSKHTKKRVHRNREGKVPKSETMF